MTRLDKTYCLSHLFLKLHIDGCWNESALKDRRWCNGLPLDFPKAFPLLAMLKSFIPSEMVLADAPHSLSDPCQPWSFTVLSELASVRKNLEETSMHITWEDKCFLGDAVLLSLCLQGKCTGHIPVTPCDGLDMGWATWCPSGGLDDNSHKRHSV